MKPWSLPLDVIQGYLAAGVSLHPCVERAYLEMLYEREQVHKDVCLLPSSRLQLYHIHLYDKLKRRLTQRYRNVA